MLSEHELFDLAESIKTDGLLLPIVLDPDGVLLDGRNRLAACELAGVEPRFTTYTDTDQTAFIILCNVRRRNLSEGQRAMIHAMVLSRSGQSLRTHAKQHAISRSRLSLANTVLKHSPDLAEQVTEGHLTLDAATTTLDQRREQQRLRQRVEHIDAIRLGDHDSEPALAPLAERGDIDWHQAHHRAEQYLAQRQTAIHRDQQHLQAIVEHWPALLDLARHPDSPYVHEVLNDLATEARTLVGHLITVATSATNPAG